MFGDAPKLMVLVIANLNNVAEQVVEQIVDALCMTSPA